MDKLEKVLGTLEKQDLLRERRESRSVGRAGYALDFDSLFDPDPQREAELEDWFDRLNSTFANSGFDNESLWESEGHDKSGVMTLAWYQPLSYHKEEAGIFITDLGIWKYANAIRRQVRLEASASHQASTTVIPANICIALAIEILLLHETFHHDVEWFTLRLNTLHAEHFLYEKYDRMVYAKSQKLEESLASARMQIGLSSKQNKQRFDQVWLQAKNLLQMSAPNQPTGYNNANRYQTPTAHADGRRELAASINQLNPVPKTIALGETFGIGKGKLSDYFRENFLIVPIERAGGFIVPPESMTFSIPKKDIGRMLTKRGYFNSGLGKGSHDVWKHNHLPAITLPTRREFEGYQVLNNIRESLGIESLNELRREAQRA
jgi:hypothetical protein